MGVLLWWAGSSETEILETLADVEVLIEAEASVIADDKIEDVRLDARGWLVGRLDLAQLPAGAAVTPEKPECPDATPLQVAKGAPRWRRR